MAVGFAHLGAKVVIVDTDTNNSCKYWSRMRDKNLVPVSVLSFSDVNSLKNNIETLNREYDFVIIDGTPALSELVNTIMLLGDIVLIPIRPSGLDLHATQLFMERYEMVKKLNPNMKARFLLNQYNPNLKFSQEVNQVLQKLNIPTLENSIKLRVAYVEVVVQGLGVIEYKDLKAKEEMDELTKELMLIMQSFTINLLP